MSSYYGSMLCVFWSIFRAELGDVKGNENTVSSLLPSGHVWYSCTAVFQLLISIYNKVILSDLTGCNRAYTWYQHLS